MNGSNACGGEPGSTSANLVVGVKALDPAAWHQFAVLYGPLIYRWARRAGLDSEDAADVTQDVFRAVAVGAPHIHHGSPGDTFRGWLWTITRNKLRDFWRGRADRPVAAGGTGARELLRLVANSDPESGPEFPAESEGLIRRAIELVRAEFEPRSWDAFWRVTIEGGAAGDVARELGMTTNAIYVARSRILRRFRDLLAEGGIGPDGDATRHPPRG